MGVYVQPPLHSNVVCIDAAIWFQWCCLVIVHVADKCRIIYIKVFLVNEPSRQECRSNGHNDLCPEYSRNASTLLNGVVHERSHHRTELARACREAVECRTHLKRKQGGRQDIGCDVGATRNGKTHHTKESKLGPLESFFRHVKTHGESSKCSGNQPKSINVQLARPQRLEQQDGHNDAWQPEQGHDQILPVRQLCRVEDALENLRLKDRCAVACHIVQEPRSSRPNQLPQVVGVRSNCAPQRRRTPSGRLDCRRMRLAFWWWWGKELVQKDKNSWNASESKNEAKLDRCGRAIKARCRQNPADNVRNHAPWDLKQERPRNPCGIHVTSGFSNLGCRQRVHAADTHTKDETKPAQDAPQCLDFAPRSKGSTDGPNGRESEREQHARPPADGVPNGTNQHHPTHCAGKDSAKKRNLGPFWLDVATLGHDLHSNGGS
eukprot:m.205202 g.205202  ORF g.205202 m.205202 type:complete len:435 (+) comp22856_c0_seq1:54-1358(+)